MDFLPKDLLSEFDIGNIFSNTDSYDPVLEPSIRAFHFPFGLWRQGISDFHIAILQNLLPLRSGLVSQEVVLSPTGVYVVGVRESVLKDDGLKGQDMGPSGILFDQGGIKDQPAVIIQGSNEVPFLLGCWCPEMIGGVVLD
jgi:hypothetical protein